MHIEGVEVGWHWDGTYYKTLLCIAYVIYRDGIVCEWCLLGAPLCILLHIPGVEVGTGQKMAFITICYYASHCL